MNEIINSSIEARKTAIYNAYSIEDKEIREKIDNLFDRIYKFGEEFDDVQKFESEFASSTLNKEYTDLFIEISKMCTPKTYVSEVDPTIKSDSDMIKDEITSEIKYQAESLTQPIRREANQKFYDEVRDVPVVGDVLNVKQHVDFFSRFRKKKDEE